MIIYNDSGEYTFNDGIQLRQSSEENSQVSQVIFVSCSSSACLFFSAAARVSSSARLASASILEALLQILLARLQPET